MLGLLDTGAMENAFSEAELRRILTAYPAALCGELPAPNFKLHWQRSTCTEISTSPFLHWTQGVRGNIYSLAYNVQCTQRHVILEKCSITLDLSDTIVRFSDITPQTRFMIKVHVLESSRTNKLVESKTTQKTVIQPRQQVIVPVKNERYIGAIKGRVESLPATGRRSHLLVSPALREIQQRQSHVQITNPLDYQKNYCGYGGISPQKP